MLYFAHEVNTKKISFSSFDLNNKQIAELTYSDGPRQGPLYLQTPLLKFVNKITQKTINNNIYNELYLMIDPNNKSNILFMNILNEIDNKLKTFICSKTKKLEIDHCIKSLNIDETIINFIRMKLLKNTIIEYNNKSITISQLNNLINNIDIQVIIEINIIWGTNNKFGLFLKPIRLRAVNNIQNINFRKNDDSDDMIELIKDNDNNNDIINSSIKKNKKCDTDKSIIINKILSKKSEKQKKSKKSSESSESIKSNKSSDSYKSTNTEESNQSSESLDINLDECVK